MHRESYGVVVSMSVEWTVVSVGLLLTAFMCSETLDNSQD